MTARRAIESDRADSEVVAPFVKNNEEEDTIYYPFSGAKYFAEVPDLEITVKEHTTSDLTFYFAGKSLKEITSTSLFNLTYLTSLNLSHNELVDIPIELGNLVELTSLDLSFNKLIALPFTIGRLTKLESLIVNYNRLTTLPKGLVHLNKLQTLNLNFNLLRHLPQDIGKLTSLKSLTCNCNMISSLPQGIVWLINLEVLALEDNRIKTLPGGLGELGKLKDVRLVNNPLEPDLQQAADRGVDKLFTYLHTLEQDVLVSHSSMNQDLLGLWTSKSLSDLTFQPKEGNPVLAHKCIIALSSITSCYQKQLLANKEMSTIEIDGKFDMVEKLVKFLSSGISELKMENKDEILLFLSFCHSKQVEAVDEFTIDMFGKESTQKLFDFLTNNSDVTQIPYDLSFEISTALFSKTTILNNELAVPISLASALFNETFSDVMFIVEEKPIHAHKAILASRSIYFHTMFLGGFTESQKGQMTVPIEEVSYDIFKLVLEFVYTDNVVEINGDNAIELLQAADIYSLERLKQLCEKLIAEGIDESNVYSLLEIGDTWRCSQLKSRCLTWFFKNHVTAVTTNEWKEMRQELKELVEARKDRLESIAALKNKATEEVSQRGKRKIVRGRKTFVPNENMKE